MPNAKKQISISIEFPPALNLLFGLSCLVFAMPRINHEKTCRLSNLHDYWQCISKWFETILHLELYFYKTVPAMQKQNLTGVHVLKRPICKNELWLKLNQILVKYRT